MKNLAELRPLPDELRSNWGRAYQHWFVNPPRTPYISDMERLQRKAGIKDELIVAVIEKGLQTKRLNVMAWTRTVLEELVPFGVTTPDEWEEFERQRAEQAAQLLAKQQSGRQPATSPSKRQPKFQGVDPDEIMRN